METLEERDASPPACHSIEQPRLASFLQTVLFGEPPPDFDREYLDRQKLVEEKLKRLSPESRENSDFTWKEYLESAEAGSEASNLIGNKTSREVRRQFNDFLAQVSKTLESWYNIATCQTDLLKSYGCEGEGISASATARMIFNAAAKVPGRKTGKIMTKEEVEAALGPISGGDWKILSQMAKQLREWQLANTEGGNGSSQRGPASKKEAQTQERNSQLGKEIFTMHFQYVDPWEALETEDEMVGSTDEEEEESEVEEVANSQNVPDKVLEGGAKEGSAGWLLAVCAELVAFGKTVFTSAAEAAESILTMFQSSSSEEELQTHLFDLLGFDSFELIQKLLVHQQALKRMTTADLRAAEELGSITDSMGEGRSGRPALVGASISVMTEEEKAISKKLRKQKKKARNANTSDEEGQDWLEQVGFDAEYLRQQRALGLQKNLEVHRAFMTDHKSMLKDAQHLEYYEQKRGLPQGTTRNMQKGYEEVFVPAATSVKADKGSLVPISMMPEYAQLAFQGMSHLNRLQSHLFDAAFHSNENLLVCAPTGAGKTNVAMLTIMRELSNRMVNGVIQRQQVKIVYVAPMKALAQEVVEKFSERLRPLQLVVRELTGDMQLTRREIDETQIIVTTPEKWDVITRKTNDGSLVQQVKLLIIDEVHLLADDRGAVIETLVARTLRLVEATQSLIRIVGLSATLPNYQDVGVFLRANQSTGVFYFDGRYRPVPLEQTFIGVTEKSRLRQLQVMNQVVYEKAIHSIREGNQVMIFVHSRKDTAKTARSLHESACKADSAKEFLTVDNPAHGRWLKEAGKSRNSDVRELYNYGIGIHHAGMLRADRTLSERLFAAGVIKVLCCTATLAWGVNLPAHTVIIKGTQIYNAEKGGFSDLSMLDVMQIFGRAGRPQFDTSGEAIMVTTHDKLPHYLGMLTQQTPIESNFIKALPDHLNAEVASGTVTNIREAVTWLSYTYLYVRMLRNPMAYGISYEEKARDRELAEHRSKLIERVAQQLDECRMMRYDQRSGNLAVVDLGRVASHYYIRHESIQIYNEMLHQSLSDPDLLFVLCSSMEFENVKVRDEEMTELETLKKKCPLEVKGGLENTAGKVNILLQSYISNMTVKGFTLVSDTNYVIQNAGRIARAVFEICLTRNWSSMAERLLVLAKTIDRRMWWFQSPLRQFPHVPLEIIRKLEDRNVGLDELYDMSATEIGSMVHHVRMGDKVVSYLQYVPYLEIETNVQPITRGILRMSLSITAPFTWHDKYSGPSEPWWIWVEDAESERIYHSEYFILHRKSAGDTQNLSFAIPIFEPMPSQYFIRVVSDRWVGVSSVFPVSFQHLILPERHPPHTNLLDLHPLPKEALKNELFESIYRFSHFNPIQTQIFHNLYHQQTNVLLGAPTGSGKTVAAELAIYNLWNNSPESKAVYIAPLKALSRERVADWKRKFEPFGRKVVELTGDSAPDMRALKSADILITTPEKWDGVTRNWRKRDYVTMVQLVIIDEIHLLGQDRGPILEVIVSRMRFIASQTNKPVRFVGLSTALANAQDLADWLGIEKEGLYNFRPSVRPIPMEVHIQGFPGKHYCPRMATMNKPAYASIMQHSPTKPVLVFVSSRRQTRLTALDLISYCAADINPKQFLHMDEQAMDMILPRIQDTSLRHTLAFGIGIHHAGLNAKDRDTVEELFCNGLIQVLVCTSTLAWGVNFPAHLVIIKGTEYYDAKSHRYVDFPITDVLQMMGRAGRPQFDTIGISCIFVHEPKKDFFRKFLYEPFPVESSLKAVLHNHFNAEIASGTVKSKQDAVDYLTWTYFFRRLLQNPSYYNLDDTSKEGVNAYLLELVDGTMEELQFAGCVEIEDDFNLKPTLLGHLASFYYLEYNSPALIRDAMAAKSASLEYLTLLLSSAHEFDELPVRHNEDKLNADLLAALPWKTEDFDAESPYLKTFLLLQCHFFDIAVPIADYINDTKSVLDQCPRIINAMMDIAASEGYLEVVKQIAVLSQMIVQGLQPDSNEFAQLPGLGESALAALTRAKITKLSQVLQFSSPPLPQQQVLEKRRKALRKALEGSPAALDTVVDALEALPAAEISWRLVSGDESNKVYSGQNVKVDFSVRFTNKKFKTYVSSTKFHKPKEHGFWVGIGRRDTDELLAVKRVTMQKNLRASLQFVAPEASSQGVEGEEMAFEIFWLSDSLLGIDKSLEMKLRVVPKE